MIWSSQQLTQALGVHVDPAIQAEKVQFNSLDVKHGDLFIALKGNKDGHIYARDAINAGAAAVIVTKASDNIDINKQIVVDDTYSALLKMAEYKRNNSKAIFIGITGSVGKTSTKEMLKAILQPFGSVFASRGTFNNYLGVMINLASMQNELEYAVFEMGMNHSGEIRELTKLVRPNIALITSIGEAHLEFFDSVLDIVDAKCEIFEGLADDGSVVVNLDNKYYHRILSNIERMNLDSVYTFGKNIKSNSTLKTYQKIGDRLLLEYAVNGENLSAEIMFMPEHYAKNFAAVLMVGALLKINLNIAINELKLIEPIDGRGKIVNASIGTKKCRLICDHYNANPESMKAAFEYLHQINSEKKIAIIADMLELGATSIELHKTVVSNIIKSGVQKIFLVGSIVTHICDLLPNNIKALCFDNVDSLCLVLETLIGGDELILIKGSKSMNLNKIFEYFNLNE